MCVELDYIISQLNINVCATRLHYMSIEYKVAEYKTPLITSITMLESVCNYAEECPTLDKIHYYAGECVQLCWRVSNFG